MEFPPVVRKFIAAGITGAAAFLVTNVTRQPTFPGLVLSLLVGGMVLLVQFLYELERRQLAVEAAVDSLRQEGGAAADRVRAVLRAEIRKIGDATLLHQRLEQTPHGLDLITRIADGLDGGTPSLAMRVARAEVSAAVDFLDAVSRSGEAIAEGEDRDWLTALTRLSGRSIDAITHASESADAAFSDDGLWDTEIGNHYLELQRDAIRRGVQVRRLFVVPNDHTAEHPDLLALARQHRATGITVRTLSITDLLPSQRHHIPDVVIFDEEVSYQLTAATRLDPALPRYFVNTRFTVQPDLVGGRLQLFRDLWDAGRELA
jgi:hypothetical protein